MDTQTIEATPWGRHTLNGILLLGVLIAHMAQAASILNIAPQYMTETAPTLYCVTTNGWCGYTADAEPANVCQKLNALTVPNGTTMIFQAPLLCKSTNPFGYSDMPIQSDIGCPASVRYTHIAYVMDFWHYGRPLCVRNIPDACPANATSNGMQCICNSGYATNQAGTACVQECPAHANGTPCTCDTGYEWDLGHTQCVPQEKYTLTLTGATQTEPSQPLSFVATVIDKATQQPPTKEVTVKISLTVDDKSGGHDHGDSTRPRGSLNDKACASDDTCITLTAKAGNGTAPFTFTPRDASGKHTITASCDKCSSEGTGNTKTVTVKVDGLLEIPASTFYVLGSSSRHGTKNHYLLPAAAEKLLLLAINYQSQGLFKVMNPNTNTMVWPAPFRVNDASLEWGGRFDIYGDWTKPHKEHIRGVSVDLRANEGMPNAIPPENFLKFDELLSNTLMPDGIGEVSFLECTKDKKDKKGAPATPKHRRIPENFCVSQLDGSFDTNRHYHVRLMGVAK